MAYDLATVTNSGNQLLASLVPDKSSLVIDKIEVSGTQLASSTDLKSMTSISNVVKTLSANGYQKKDNSFIISTVLDNSSVDADYKAWVFGIWAHKSDGGSSILMSVITSTSSPDTISKGSGTPIDYNYKFITTFSNTSSLKIQMASDTYSTNDTVLHNSGDETATGTKTFQEIKISNTKFPSLVQTDGQYITLDGGTKELVPADDSKVVHTTGDETIDGQKKFKTDPTDGAGNAYAKTVDVNQQLDKKVVDNKDGTEQLNGIQVQPYNKLSDTIGGRNLIVAKTIQNKTVLTGRGTVFLNYPSGFTTDYIPVVANQKYTVTIYDTTISCISRFAYYDSSKNFISRETDRNISTSSSEVIVIPSGASYIKFSPDTPDKSGKYEDNYKFEQGPIATDWTPAPEDKVNVSDMRKPASDVVGLEDVSTSVYKGGVAENTDLNTLTQEGIYNFKGTSFVNFIDSDIHWGTIQIINKSAMVIQFVICTSNILGDQIFFRTQSGNPRTWLRWTMVPRFSMGGSLKLPNGENLKPADDSKVAHLSGANNFDTVPTVKNNPLLLASSLPSDLARTGQAQTFTAAQTFSIAPTIKDASKDKGDNQAATMADLKSVEADAWHVAESNYPGLLMQVDRDDKIIYILSTGDPTTTRIIDSSGDYPARSSTICDLSSYIDGIVSASGYIRIAYDYGMNSDQYNLDFKGAKLLANANGGIIRGEGGYSVLGDPKILNNTSAFFKLQYNSWIGE